MVGRGDRCDGARLTPGRRPEDEPGTLRDRHLRGRGRACRRAARVEDREERGRPRPEAKLGGIHERGADGRIRARQWREQGDPAPGGRRNRRRVPECHHRRAHVTRAHQGRVAAGQTRQPTREERSLRKTEDATLQAVIRTDQHQSKSPQNAIYSVNVGQNEIRL